MAYQSAPEKKAKFCSLVINFYYQLYKVQTSVQTYRAKSLTALVFLPLWSFSRSFWAGQVIANFREIIRAPDAIACPIILSFTDQNLQGGLLKLN